MKRNLLFPLPSPTGPAPHCLFAPCGFTFLSLLYCIVILKESLSMLHTWMHPREEYARGLIWHFGPIA